MNEREAVHSPAAGRSKQDDGREGREREAASPRRILAFLLPPAAAAAASGGGGGADSGLGGVGRRKNRRRGGGDRERRNEDFFFPFFFFSSPSRRCGAAESTWPCGKVRFLRLVFPVTDHTHEMHASFSSAPPSYETEVNEANGGFHVRKGGASPPSG